MGKILFFDTETTGTIPRGVMLDWWLSGLSEAQWIAAHYHQYKLNI